MSKFLSPRTRDATVGLVCALRNVREREVMGRSSERKPAHARQHAMWLLRQQGYAYPQIGLAFGRHHTVAMHGVRAHALRIGVPVSDDSITRKIMSSGRYPQKAPAPSTTLAVDTGDNAA